MQVTDATGSGAGWNTQIAATQFVCQSGSCFTASNGPHNLDPNDPKGSPLYLTNVTAACAAGNGCTSPASSTPIATPVYATGAATPFYSDDVNAGMGISNVGTDLNLFVPGNTYAGTYQSVVTLAVVSGP
jgi:hypothetical protein